MADEFEQIGSFLSRWSRRKLEKDRAPASSQPPAPASAAPGTAQDAQGAAAAGPEPAASGEVTLPEVPLPPVENLTPDSDFTPFMRPEVDAGLKSAALKQLFKAPHFNVMDGLDTYVDDYSIPDPIPDRMMKTMYQAREHLFSEEEKALADAVDAADAERASEADALARELDALGDRSAQTTAGAEPGPDESNALTAPNAPRIAGEA